MRIDPHRATRRRAVSSAALDTPVRVTVRQAVPPTTARSPKSWRCVARSNPPDAATLDQHPELSGDHATRVPCVKGEIVALLPPRALPAGLEVTALFVAPEHQRQGHGPLLIADAASRAVPSLRWRARHASDPAGLALSGHLGALVVHSTPSDGGPSRARARCAAHRRCAPPPEPVQRLGRAKAATAANCAAAPSTVRAWKTSWKPKTRGQGSGLRVAYTAAPRL